MLVAAEPCRTVRAFVWQAECGAPFGLGIITTGLARQCGPLGHTLTDHENRRRVAVRPCDNPISNRTASLSRSVRPHCGHPNRHAVDLDLDHSRRALNLAPRHFALTKDSKVRQEVPGSFQVCGLQAFVETLEDGLQQLAGAIWPPLSSKQRREIGRGSQLPSSRALVAAQFK